MSEMVERVARALAALDFESPDEEFKARHIDAAWQIYVDEARAAIEAMREPTEEMMSAVVCGGDKADWTSGRAWKAGFGAMIDAALK